MKERALVRVNMYMEAGGYSFSDFMLPDAIVHVDRRTLFRFYPLCWIMIESATTWRLLYVRV